MIPSQSICMNPPLCLYINFISEHYMHPKEDVKLKAMKLKDAYSLEEKL